MAESRNFIKNKNVSMTRLLLLVSTIALMFIPQSSTLELRSNESSCSDSRTCTNCTFDDRCVWFLERQACASKTQYNSSSLIVSSIAKCPRISLNNHYKYLQNKDGERVLVLCFLNVSNDSVGFMKYLINSNINLSIGRSVINVDIGATKNNVLIFKEYEYLNWSSEQQLVTYYVSINFNDVNLQFDNETDHYLTIYRTRCINDERDKHCVTCAWIKDGHSNYLKWCPSKNTCNGRNRLYLKNDTILNERELSPVNDVAHVNNDCAEINVTAVHPLSGPRDGGTAMIINVTNHWIFAEDRTVTVSVAGTECKNLRISGPETITCTTSSPLVNATGGVISGPVLVQYSSPEGRVMTIESSQTFQFVVAPICGTPHPVIDAYQPLSGMVSGGTAVPVRGKHFVEPCVAARARLYVVLANGVRQHGRCDPPVNDTYMVCRSPQVNRGIAGWDAHPSLEGWLLSFGLDFDFTGNQSMSVDVHSLGFYVHPDPVLTDLEIDGNGSVVIKGDRLQYVRPDDIAVRSRGSAYVGCVEGSTTHNRVVCVPTASVSWSREIMVKIGTRLVYTVVKISSPQSDDQFTAAPTNWYIAIIALSLSLAFVGVLVWYLRTKNWYGCSLSKTASDAPMKYRWVARPRHKYRTVT